MDDYAKVGDALIALRQISRATSSDSRMLARASGLSVSQLIALQEVSAAGSISPSRMAKRMALSRGTMTTLMRKLEDRRLVERSSDTIDKRRHFFSLTDSGKLALEEAPVMLHEKFSIKFGELKSWEQTLIISALERVARLSNRAFDHAEATLTDGGAIRRIIEDFLPDAVIHFAGLKAVGESELKPLSYYEENVLARSSF